MAPYAAYPAGADRAPDSGAVPSPFDEEQAALFHQSGYPPFDQRFRTATYWQPPQQVADSSMGVPPLFSVPNHWPYAAKPMGPAKPILPFNQSPLVSDAHVLGYGAPPTAFAAPPPMPIMAEQAPEATTLPPQPGAPEVAPAETPPVHTPSRQPTRIMLDRLHPSAFGANGYALIDTVSGDTEVTVRGLPSPTLLGNGLTTYKVWLVSERSRAYLPLGACTKLFGDTYRLTALGLPLHRYESVLVTAEEQPNNGVPVGVKVMAASL